MGLYSIHFRSGIQHQTFWDNLQVTLWKERQPAPVSIRGFPGLAVPATQWYELHVYLHPPSLASFHDLINGGYGERVVAGPGFLVDLFSHFPGFRILLKSLVQGFQKFSPTLA